MSTLVDVLHHPLVAGVLTGEEFRHDIQLHDVYSVKRFEVKLLFPLDKVNLVLKFVNFEDSLQSILKEEAFVIS